MNNDKSNMNNLNSFLEECINDNSKVNIFTIATYNEIKIQTQKGYKIIVLKDLELPPTEHNIHISGVLDVKTIKNILSVWYSKLTRHDNGLSSDYKDEDGMALTNLHITLNNNFYFEDDLESADITENNIMKACLELMVGFHDNIDMTRLVRDVEKNYPHILSKPLRAELQLKYSYER